LKESANPGRSARPHSRTATATSCPAGHGAPWRAAVRAAPVLALAVCVVLSGAGCLGRSQAEEEEEAVPVEVAPAERGNLVVRATIPAGVTAAAEVNVSPKIGGRVAEVHVEVGDAVRAGAPIVSLEDSEIRAQVRQAEAMLDVAQANLAQLRSSPRQEELKQAEAGLEQAEANYENAKQNFERIQGLYEQGAVSKQQYDSVELQLSVAKAQYEQAQEAYSMAESGPTSETLSAAKAQVRQAEATLQLARFQLDNATVCSPIAGTVSAVNVDAGEMVSKGTPVAVVVDVSRLYAEGSAPEGLVDDLAAGDPVTVSVPAIQGSYTGTVKSISPAADPRTKTFPVKVEIDVSGSPPPPRPGMFAEISVVDDMAADAVIVPQEALISQDGGQVLYVVEGGVARERSVEVGLSDGERAEILSGIEEGERVVVAGQHYLTDGAPVSIEAGEPE